MVIYVHHEQEISLHTASWIVNDFLLLTKRFSFLGSVTGAVGVSKLLTHIMSWQNRTNALKYSKFSKSYTWYKVMVKKLKPYKHIAFLHH